MSDLPIQILLIAQDPHNDRLLRDLLSKILTLQFDLQWLNSYQEGLEQTKANQHDLYFIAENLEQSTGLELLKESRKYGCDRSIFFLIESEKDELRIEEIKAIESAGATDYFQKKKIDADVLEHSIRYALKEQEMNEALRISQERYALALSAGEVGVWDWNLSNNQLYVAPNLKAMLGYANDDINPNWEQWQQTVHPDDREKVKTVLNNHLAGLTSQYEVEYRRLHKDGTWRWFLSRGNTLRDANGQPCRMAGSETDITERKQLEAYLRQSLAKEKEINQLKSQFLTMVSHEFRTPLATILSSADLLEFYIEEVQTENALNHVERLQNAAEYMTQMLNDVLIMEDANTGKLNFNPVLLDLYHFCDEVIKNLEFSIQRTKVINADNRYQIRLQFNQLDKPEYSENHQLNQINGLFDKSLMKQLLTHLLLNAIRYSPNGGEIIVEIEVVDEEEIILKVIDYGIGIAKEEQSQIFEMFYRGENIENIPGSGLGLAIVKTCVYLHGGEISVQSELGVGSTFTVKLPWCQSFEGYERYTDNLTDVEIMSKNLDITKID
jgi:PAS domain S-box-containing protein